MTQDIEWIARYRARYAQIQSTVQAACTRVGRKVDDVRIVAVTKYVEAPVIYSLLAAGIHAFGENRWQQAKPKLELSLPEQPEWHFIGRLQRNKVGVVARHFDWIHSVDSLPLLTDIAAAAVQAKRHVRCLLQVNVSGEATKQGMNPDDVASVISATRGLAGVSVCGLMTMAPAVEDVELTRPVFRALADLRGTISADLGLPEFRELSMGMSADYAVAVEEGATLIRVGRTLVARDEP